MSLPFSLSSLPRTVKALQMPAIYIGATLTKAGHIFSLRKIVLSLRIVTAFEDCLSVKKQRQKMAIFGNFDTRVL